MTAGSFTIADRWATSHSLNCLVFLLASSTASHPCARRPACSLGSVISIRKLLRGQDALIFFSQATASRRTTPQSTRGATEVLAAHEQTFWRPGHQHQFAATAGFSNALTEGCHYSPSPNWWWPPGSPGTLAFLYHDDRCHVSRRLLKPIRSDLERAGWCSTYGRRPR